MMMMAMIGYSLIGKERGCLGSVTPHVVVNCASRVESSGFDAILHKHVVALGSEASHHAVSCRVPGPTTNLSETVATAALPDLMSCFEGRGGGRAGALFPHGARAKLRVDPHLAYTWESQVGQCQQSSGPS